MAETAKIMTLHDHDTGEAIAPRTDVKALSGEGKKWNYVGFTEDNQVGLIEGTWPCNRNLLDNWYFANPVNQRGQISYTATGYFIDRWRTNTTTTVDNPITLSAQGLQSGKTELDIYQLIEAERIQRGQSYTVSAIINGELCSRTIRPDEWGVNQIIREQGNVRTRLNVVGKNIEFALFCGAGELTVTAVKLELGPQQTLAHKEGDKWVLNEIPDYATELAKCQRYQLVIGNKDTPASVGGGNARSDTMFSLHIPTPVSFRSSPTISISGSGLLVFRNANKQNNIGPSSFNGVTNAYSMHEVIISITTSGLTPGEYYESYMGADTYILLDANL